MNINISERILAVAEEKGLNKKVLADRLDIQPQNINSTVLKNPKFEMLEKVADTLGVTIGELVGDEPRPDREPLMQQTIEHGGRQLRITIDDIE